MVEHLHQWIEYQNENGNKKAAEAGRMLRIRWGDTPLEERVKSYISPDSIMEELSRYFGLTKEELSNQDRRRAISYPRQIGMFIMRQMTTIPLVEIGRHFEKNHSTVLNGIRRVERLAVFDNDTRNQVNDLRTIIESKRPPLINGKEINPGLPAETSVKAGE